MKKNDYLTWGVIIAVVLLFLWLWSKYKDRQVGQRTGAVPVSPADFLAQNAGPSGYATPSALNGVNSSGAPNLAMNTYSYEVPVPDFTYSGNSQIYMPLFGFVGYSSSGTL